MCGADSLCEPVVVSRRQQAARGEGFLAVAVLSSGGSDTWSTGRGGESVGSSSLIACSGSLESLGAAYGQKWREVLSPVCDQAHHNATESRE